MRQLPRNERRPPSSSLPPTSDRWGMVLTPTPPPVAVGPRHPDPIPDPPASRHQTRVALFSLLSFVVAVAAVRLVSRDATPRNTSQSAASPSQVAAPVPPPQSPFDRALEATKAVIQAAAEPSPQPPVPVAHSAAPVAFNRHGYSTLRGGVLHFPESFSPSAEGTYDLLIHFHGNVKIVVESAEAAKLNAMVAVINLGVGSGVYEAGYAVPGTYEALLDQVQAAAAERGIESPRLRRVALTSWSAGYGAISTILQVRRGGDPLDALIVMDGLHCGRLPHRQDMLNALQMAPFVQAARASANRTLLFSITHSEIDPVTYVSSQDTATYLLDAVRGDNVLAAAELVAPTHLHLKSAEKAVEPKLEKHMEPTRDVRVGDLHVQGYRGQTAEHHIAHLTQMGATVLPELVARWATKR